MDRKQFLQLSGLAVFSTGIPSMISSYMPASEGRDNDLFFDISLAQWSLHRTIFDGKIDHLEFPSMAKKEFGIEAVEYVNQFFADRAEDKDYLAEMNRRCNDLGIDQVLIMIDGEGSLAQTNDKERMEAVENHYKWVAAAEYLNCYSIRVNLHGDGMAAEQKKAAVDSLGRLSEFAQDYQIDIIVENHGGYSSNGQWLSDVITEVNMENCGTLPDFGNFCIKSENGNCVEEYDRYQGVEDLMPFAKGVSAKSYDFDQEGRETTIDFPKMLKIIRDAGYDGYIGIEYEGDRLSEKEGIEATKNLLTEVGRSMADDSE